MSSTPRRVLIVGATGFVGSHLARRLADPSAPVECLVFSDRHQERRLPDLPGSVPLVVRSSGEDALKRVLGSTPYDVVFNLAAGGVRAESRSPLDLLEGSPMLLTRLLLALRDTPPRLVVHTGSWLEYGNTSSREPLKEDHPLLCDSLYGASKAAATMFGNALARDLRIPFVTLRLFSVFGRGEAPQRLIPYMVSRLAAGQEVDLTDGNQVRDFVYVDDVVEAFVAASVSPRLEHNTAYNACSGKPLSVRAVAEMVADSMRVPRRLLAFGRRAGRPDEPEWAVGDPSRMAAATGWSADTTVEEGIRRMLASDARTTA